MFTIWGTIIYNSIYIRSNIFCFVCTQFWHNMCDMFIIKNTIIVYMSLHSKHYSSSMNNKVAMCCIIIVNIAINCSIMYLENNIHAWTGSGFVINNGYCFAMLCQHLFIFYAYFFIQAVTILYYYIKFPLLSRMDCLYFCQK